MNRSSVGGTIAFILQHIQAYNLAPPPLQRCFLLDYTSNDQLQREQLFPYGMGFLANRCISLVIRVYE